MSKPLKKDGVLVGFEDVPTFSCARDRLDEAGVVYDLAYRAEDGIHIYFNLGTDINVASYCGDTGTVLILRRPDHWREHEYEILLDRRQPEPSPGM